MNEQKLKTLAKDLRKEDPRHVATRMAGFEGAARCLDKCRATLLGWNGEFQYGCPMDQAFFREAGVDKEDFKTFVATGASDNEVEEWLQQHAGRPVAR